MTDLTAASEGALIEAYLKLRKKRDLAKAEFNQQQKPVLDGMRAVEAELLRRLTESDLDSFATDVGTAYTTTKRSASLEDRAAFFEYVQEHDAWNLMDYKANVTAVTSFSEENGGSLPPGVKFRAEQSVNIRLK